MIDTIAARCGSSPAKADSLLGMLLALIRDQRNDGISGFLGLFRGKGLGGLVDSWTGAGPSLPITPSQVESALGIGVPGAMALQLELGRATVNAALAAMLPEVIARLTHADTLPRDPVLESRLQAASGEFDAWLAGIGTWRFDATDDRIRAFPHASHGDASPQVRQQDGSALRRLLPWLLLAGLLLAGLLLTGLSLLPD